MNHTQHILGDLAAVGNGLVLFALGAANNMQLLQILGLVVGIGGVGVGISREIRNWKRGT